MSLFSMRKNKSSVKAEKIENKKNIFKLIICFLLLLSIYFGFIKSGIQIIQEIYIWGAFILALIYIFSSFGAAFIKEKKSQEDSRIQKQLMLLHQLEKNILIVLVSAIFSLLIDYMLILTGTAKYFGI